MSIRIGSIDELGINSSDVSKFYDDHWAKKIALSNSVFYNWQFKSLPAALGQDNCVVGYDSKECRIVGVMGLNVRPFHLNGRRMRGAELTTWIVHPHYRSSGVGARIVSFIQGRYDVLIGMGISSAALPISLRSGFRFLHGIPRFVRIFDFEAIKDIANVEPLAWKLARDWSKIGSRAPTADYTVSEALDDDIDSLFGRMLGQFNLYARDAAHMRWRYRSHPFFCYKIFIIRDRQHAATALVALRHEAAISDLRVVHVTDCIGDQAAIPLAFNFIVDYCRQNMVHVVDFFCTSSRINRYPLSLGWFSTLDDHCMRFPHLFNPVELRTPATTSLIYWSRDNFDEMCDFSKLYVTKQDADFDRPILPAAD